MSDEKINIPADFIITAFGSENTQNPIKDVLLSNGKLDINKKTMQHNRKKHVFAGGDILGTQNLVDAVNDGKVASWYIHRFIS
jgi:dihydropyrimidine dehydrogenase (NADP+)